MSLEGTLDLTKHKSSVYMIQLKTILFDITRWLQGKKAKRHEWHLGTKRQLL